MSLENLEQVLAYLAPFGLRELHLLPFHQYGESKYGLVGLDYAMKDVKPPEEHEVEPYIRRAEAAGYRVTVGG
jgi:pyruvate formate lyase activating enzyme